MDFVKLILFVFFLLKTGVSQAASLTENFSFYFKGLHPTYQKTTVIGTYVYKGQYNGKAYYVNRYNQICYWVPHAWVVSNQLRTSMLSVSVSMAKYSNESTPDLGNQAWFEAATGKMVASKTVRLVYWTIPKYSNGAENLTYWNKSDPLIQQKNEVWHLPQKGFWIESQRPYTYPITVRAEIKADSKACIQMGLFYDDIAHKNDGILITTEGDQVIPKPGNWKESISANTDWHTVMFVVKKDKYIHWYIAFREIFLQIPFRVQGKFGFIAQCGGMKIRNVFVQIQNGTYENEKSHAPCGYNTETDVSEARNCDLGATCVCSGNNSYVLKHCHCEPAPKKSKVVIIVASLCVTLCVLCVIFALARYFNKKNKDEGTVENGA